MSRSGGKGTSRGRGRRRDRGRGTRDVKRDPSRQVGEERLRSSTASRLRVFPHDPEPRPWRGFVPCLLVAFLLRVWVGLSGEWAVRPDELFQYAEQAHRLVFGYGLVPWEFRLGLRTWLLPAIPAAPMFVCKLLGLGHPDFYIPAVKIWNALLSLAIPAGMYLFARRITSEPAARLALLLGCFWHEFIIFSTHLLAEQYAAVVFFCALALVSRTPPTPPASRLLVLGGLLGLTAAFRLPYLPLVGVAGLLLLPLRPFSRWCLALAGGAGALVLWGFVDSLTWGRWWHSPRLFADMFVFNNLFEDWTANLPPFHRLSQLRFLAEASYGVYAAALVALIHWRRHWVLLAMIAPVLAVHLTTINQEYSNVFVLLPLLWMLIASVAQDVAQRLGRRSATWEVCAIAGAITLAVFLAGVPNPKSATYAAGFGLTPREEGVFRSEVMLKIGRGIAAIPAGQVRSVVWAVPRHGIRAGLYYHSHHRVPMLFPGWVREHEALYETRPLATLASHVVAPSGQPPPGFVLAGDYGKYSLFVNETPEEVDPPENLPTDFVLPSDAFFVGQARAHGVDFREPTERVMLF